MKHELREYDSADYLTTEEAIEAYLDEARKTGDTQLLVHAESVAKRARSKIASRHSSWRSNPGVVFPWAAGSSSAFRCEHVRVSYV